MAGRDTTDAARRGRHLRFMLGALAVLAGAVLALTASGAGAVEWGNPSFLGMLKATSPAGFPVSPSALDLTHGPVTIQVSVSVTNLTRRRHSTPIEFSIHRIVTFQGQDVSDGQPGRPGLTFPVGAAAQTTQILYLPRTTGQLQVGAGAGTRSSITFSATISDCGYYQIDFSTPTPPYAYLASGFTRALGCGTASGSTTTTVPVTTTTPTTEAVTTTSVLGETVTQPPAGTLPLTGSSPALPLISLACFALGGALLLTAARHAPR